MKVLGTNPKLASLLLPAGNPAVSELPLPSILDHIPGVAYRSIPTPQGSYQFQYISGRSLSVLGLGPEELIKDPAPFLNRIPREDLSILMSHKRAAATSAEPYRFIFRYRCAHGLRWIESSGEPISLPGGQLAYDGMFYDVTALKELELSLQRSQTLLRSAKEHIGLGCWDFDPQSGKITWSPEVFAIHGRAMELGEPDFETLASLYHPEDFQILAASVDRAIRLGQTYEHELRIIRADTGELRYVSATGGLLRNPITGEVERLFGTLLDISSQKTFAARLQAAKDAAEASAKAKSDFLATMSHEIRTPLNGILGMATLMAGTSLDERQLEYCRVIQNSSEALITVVNDILDFSRIESGKMELESIPFDLSQWLASIEEMLRVQAKAKGLALHLTQPPGELPVLGDPGRLRQVLLNLAMNALKFTEQGSIQLSLSQMESDNSHLTFEIAVADTGIGISPQALPNLFQRFSQADVSTTRRFGGTGLGLAICRTLVELMGGQIGVESTLGEGSRFWFRVSLPLFDGCLPRSLADNRIQLPRSSRPLRILLAEDNRTNQRLAMIVLEKSGHRVELAHDGQEAVDRALTGEFDLILMDCHMPRIDGYQATRLIRARSTQPIPIIALTASVFASDQKLCHESGMDDYLAKPYQPNQLLAIVERWSRPTNSPGLH